MSDEISKVAGWVTGKTVFKSVFDEIDAKAKATPRREPPAISSDEHMDAHQYGNVGLPDPGPISAMIEDRRAEARAFLDHVAGVQSDDNAVVCSCPDVDREDPQCPLHGSQKAALLNPKHVTVGKGHPLAGIEPGAPLYAVKVHGDVVRLSDVPQFEGDNPAAWRVPGGWTTIPPMRDGHPSMADAMDGGPSWSGVRPHILLERHKLSLHLADGTPRVHYVKPNEATSACFNTFKEDIVVVAPLKGCALLRPGETIEVPAYTDEEMRQFAGRITYVGCDCSSCREGEAMNDYLEDMGDKVSPVHYAKAHEQAAKFEQQKMESLERERSRRYFENRCRQRNGGVDIAASFEVKTTVPDEIETELHRLATAGKTLLDKHVAALNALDERQEQVDELRERNRKLVAMIAGFERNLEEASRANDRLIAEVRGGGASGPLMSRAMAAEDTAYHLRRQMESMLKSGLARVVDWADVERLTRHLVHEVLDPWQQMIDDLRELAPEEHCSPGWMANATRDAIRSAWDRYGAFIQRFSVLTPPRQFDPMARAMQTMRWEHATKPLTTADLEAMTVKAGEAALMPEDVRLKTATAMKAQQDEAMIAAIYGGTKPGDPK